MKKNRVVIFTFDTPRRPVVYSYKISLNCLKIVTDIQVRNEVKIWNMDQGT